MLLVTFFRRKFGYILNLFYAMRPKITEFGEITQNKGHYAIQGRLSSPILVPIESSYIIFY